MLNFFNHIKSKFEVADKKLKTQILILLVDNLSFKNIIKIFGTSCRQLNNAAKLKENGGISAILDPKLGSKITEEVKNRVVSYYTKDALVFIRFLPGKKDFVSLSHGRKQKRPLLVNLKELYQFYEKDNPLDKVGFSMFCSLWPKDCVLAGAPGTQVVCVCEKHQNLKLKLLASKCNVSYQDKITEIVCQVDSYECMFRLC